MIAFSPSKCFYCFFSPCLSPPPLPSKGMGQSHMYIRLYQVLQGLGSGTLKVIFREHRMSSVLMWSHHSQTQTVQTSLVNANKPTVWQAKCIWKQTLPFSPEECASYGNMEKLARPPIRCLHNGFTKSNRASFVHGTCLCMSLILWGPQHQFPLYFALTKACGLWGLCWSRFSVLTSFDRSISPVFWWMPSLGAFPPHMHMHWKNPPH